MATAARPEFENRLLANWPATEWCDTHVVLAVSGGADSVALLRAMASLKAAYKGTGKLYVAHLNHGLRGDAATADAAWLEALCDLQSVQLEVGVADIAAAAAEQGDGWEASAREARYKFLRHTAERLGARFVATAHTADDQVETVLHRIVRGTGVAGLAGIPKYRSLSESVVLMRPFLSIPRSSVLNYLAAIGQDYRSDATNDDVRFTRNRVRHELLPRLREHFNPKVENALLRLSAQARDIYEALEGIAADLVSDCVVVEHDNSLDSTTKVLRPALRVCVECERLNSQPAIVVREVLKLAWREAHWPMQAMGYREWQLLASMIAGACPQTHGNLPTNIRAHRDRHHLILEPPV